MSGMWMYLDHLWMQHDAAHGMRVQCSARECKVLHFFEQYLEYRQLQKPLRSKFVAANMYEDLRSCMLALPIFQVLSHSSCARVDPPQESPHVVESLLQFSEYPRAKEQRICCAGGISRPQSKSACVESKHLADFWSSSPAGIRTNPMCMFGILKCSLLKF